MNKRIIYVVDSLGWVQHKRVDHLLKNGFPYNIKVISSKWFRFLFRLGFFKKDIIYFSTWRIVHLWNKSNPRMFNDNDYQRMIAAVTSHSNIGGGLNVKYATGERDPKEAMEISLETLKKFAVVSVNSLILKELLEENLENLRYCPNGVDHNFFEFCDKKINTEKIRIGWVGKVRAAKNFPLVEETFDYLAKSNDFEPCLVRVDKNFTKAPLGPDEMRDFYHNIDYYFCSSWNEGTPNPGLEAGACGVPVITTKVGNMRELIKHGETGYFIEPNFNSVKEVLSEVKKNHEQKYSLMSKNIREEIEKSWTWKIRVENFIELFSKLMESPWKN